eukprot:COSAG02_NODE_3084_length_7397_cov_3.401617_3_plen_67_part_00
MYTSECLLGLYQYCTCWRGALDSCGEQRRISRYGLICAAEPPGGLCIIRTLPASTVGADFSEGRRM